MKTTTDTVLEHEIGPTGLLAVRLHASDLRVRAVDGPTVRISDPSGNLARSLVLERGPGSLSMRADRGVSIGIGSLGLDVARRVPDLDIEVPRGATVVLETASGDLTVDGLTGDQRYRTASGSILLREVGGRLTVDSVSGDVSINADRDCTLTARTVSGDLTLHAGTVGGLRVSTTSGDMRIEGRLAGDGPFAIESVSGDTILAPIGGVSVTVKSVTGDIRSDVTSATEGSRGSRTVTVGGGGTQLTLRSISGDLRLVHPSGRAVELPPPAPTIAIASEVPEAPTIAAVPAPPVDVTERVSDPTEAADQPAADPTVVTDEPMADEPASTADGPAADADPSLAILEALERGEIDVAEASSRLAGLDAEARS